MLNNYSKTGFMNNGWQDAFQSSKIIGWVYPLTTTRYLKYKYIDVDLVYVVFRLDGTSNATSASFTLPFGFSSQTSNLMTVGGFRVPISVANNNATNIGQLLVVREPQTGTVWCRATFGAGATNWTASGVKSLRGSFFLPVAS